jgi:hypothetical protein
MESKVEFEDPLLVAKEELKRADHLIFVSLKYTRTVDVIKSIILRLINACDAAIVAFLTELKKRRKISDVPSLPRQRVDLMRKELLDSSSYLDLFLLLRRVDKAPFDRSLEYRRHVQMTAKLDGEVVEVTIDKVHEFNERVKEFVGLIEKSLFGDE